MHLMMTRWIPPSSENARNQTRVLILTLVNWRQLDFAMNFTMGIVSLLFTFCILSLNSRSWLYLISDYMRQGGFDICLIQETMISEESTIKSLFNLWSGPSYWSPAFGRRGGVAILISSNCDGEIRSWKRDINGRVISLCVNLQSTTTKI